MSHEGFRLARGDAPPAEWRITLLRVHVSEPFVQGRRRERRNPASVSATLRERGRRAVPVEVVNLTCHGCRILSRAYLPEGSMLWIKLAHIESRYSRVVSCDGDAISICFLEPLHPAILAPFVRQHKQRRQPAKRGLTAGKS